MTLAPSLVSMIHWIVVDTFQRGFGVEALPIGYWRLIWPSGRASAFFQVISFHDQLLEECNTFSGPSSREPKKTN